MSPATNLNISGVAGEIAHGHFYPSNFAEFGQLPYADRMDALLKALSGRTIRGSGISSDARTTATGHLRRTLEDALRSGLSDARALDYFEVNGNQPASRAAPVAALPAQRLPRPVERGRRFAARGLRWAARVIER